MASKTPSRSGAKSRRQSGGFAAAKRSRPSKSRRVVSGKKTARKRSGSAGAKPAVDLKISPAIRKEWDKLTERWKDLLPKLGKGTAKRGARSSKKKARQG